MLTPGATIYFATSNVGKLAEMEALFAPSGFAIATFPAYASPVEGDASYADNAALKARALQAQLRSAGIAANVLADDSGLEVDALGGRPGVLTAEYGSGCSWPERRRMLLEELERAGPTVARTARFVCALQFIGADGGTCASFGAVDGEIADRERGERGFSFDSIFRYPPRGMTFAELSAAEKNGISHRAAAVRSLLRCLQAEP